MCDTVPQLFDLHGDFGMVIPDKLVQKLRHSQRVVVLTGAGVSAESGVPTFRDAQTGLWAKYRPEDLATPAAFQRNPQLVWEWYKSRYAMLAAVQPNPGHYALAQLEKLVPYFILITQNIDQLHQTAGSKKVVELHGSIHRTKCFDKGHFFDGWPDDTTQKPPVCEKCGSLMRPDVVWFGENLPFEALHTAQQVSEEADVFFSIGTSSQVYPAASLAGLAVERGATLIEINPTPTPLTPQAHYVLPGPSGEVLPLLLQKVWPVKKQES